MDQTFIIAGHKVVLTAIEPTRSDMCNFRMLVNDYVQEHYRIEAELAERLHFEIQSTLEALCVALHEG